jgi:DNA-binding winged helix-turn-helix (wHTH) protein/tetratricopeptide (TPR) repeat protein
MSFRFGPFVADVAAYRLLRGEQAIDLSPKALDLLFLFVTQPGELVTKDDMLRALWPDVAVTDNALTQVVSELRQALGDVPASPRYVETVPRRGYRFVATVERAGPPGGAIAAPRRVAVFDVANPARDPDLDWLCSGVAETVAHGLGALGDLRVMDRAIGSRQPPGREAEAGRRGGADLVVAGSVQRSGDRLRLTARVIDVSTREVVGQAKADGPMADVFHLQDRLVLDLSSVLSLRVTDAARARISARETASLDAYRALTEGRLRLESLDPAEVPAAIALFERALALDARYALAHVGLAHARFWMFQASRARNRPDRGPLDAALAHARAAVGLDPALAEAHAALAFLLAGADPSVESADALSAGRRAVALEPGNWRHVFRLAIAAWGEARLRDLDAVTAQYPQLTHAYFAAAMVHVARGRLDRARDELRTGLTFETGAPAGAARFPANGLHWLSGLIRLAEGDPTGAEAAFDRELGGTGRSVYADEFAMDACDGHGFVRLARGDAAGAGAMFERALARVPDHPRSLVGLAEAAAHQGHTDRAAGLLDRASRGIDALREGGREAESVMARAYWHIASGRPSDALHVLSGLLETAPRGSAGWTLPVEPWLAAVRVTPPGRALLATLASRAR